MNINAKNVKYENPTFSDLIVIAKVNVFFESKSKQQGQGHNVKIMVHVKGHFTRYTHKQYESPDSCGLRVMDKVKVSR